MTQSTRIGFGFTRIIATVDADRRGAHDRPAKSTPKVLKKGSARAMTMKERLKVHAETERQNRGHYNEWKRGINRKRKPNVRHVVAVRGERGLVA